MATRPNILFLMTDHTNAQALMPGSQCLTPNLDAFAAEGTRFGRCYTTNAICSPARASLMTGTYVSTHGVWDCTHTQRPEWVDLPPERFPHFSQLLAESGYHNGYFGKWHVEQSNTLENFDGHESDPNNSMARGEVIPGSEVVIPKAGYRDYLMAGVSEDASIQSHPAFDKGIEFIRQHVNHDERQPFLCFVSAAEPHDPYLPPKRFFDLYDLENLQVSPTLRDKLTGKPEVLRRMRSVWSGLSDADWQKISAAYWASISFLDSEVGRIIDVLKELGEYENTITIFASDHGDMLGGHGLAAKGVGTSYEEVYNIPLIMRIPGMTTGTEDSQSLVSLVDIAPTLLDLCGANPLESAQGKNLRPVLEGSADPEDWRDAYAEFFAQRFTYTQRRLYGNQNDCESSVFRFP